MKIALEAKRFFESGTGFGTYSRTLVGDLAANFSENQYFLYAPDAERNLDIASMAHSAEIERATSQKAVQVVYPPHRGKLYWKVLGARRSLQENQIDLYHGLTQQIPRSIRLSKVPKVLTIHDLIYREHPEFSPNQNLETFDRQLRTACAVSDRIIAVSESTKTDLVRFFSIPSEKIQVIYSSCDTRFHEKVSRERKVDVQGRYGLPEKYLLYVGSMTARKNLLVIVKALNEIPVEKRLPLVIIGKETDYSREVFDYADQMNLTDYLSVPSYVHTRDLPAIYQGAQVFIYMSLYEGFGLPIMEAIASGVPVVVSKTSAMPEAAGPGGALADPGDPAEIASKISEFVWDEDAREGAIKSGFAHVRKFESLEVTRSLISMYEEVAKKGATQS